MAVLLWTTSEVFNKDGELSEPLDELASFVLVAAGVDDSEDELEDIAPWLPSLFILASEPSFCSSEVNVVGSL